MQIITAKNSGFCFGVKNAVVLAENAAIEHGGKQIFTLGKLIHNESITNKLAESGIQSVETLEQLLTVAKMPANTVVIIRSHGVSNNIMQQLIIRGFIVIDATCQYVKKTHNIVSENYAKGHAIIILGQDNHPEVIGINGHCNNMAIIIDSIEDVEQKLSAVCNHLSSTQKICTVVQTTFDVNKHTILKDKIEEFFNGKAALSTQKNSLKKKYNNVENFVEFFNTVCYTTKVRQQEAVSLSKKCDIMLVLGSDKSSNTTKLLQLCLKQNPHSYLISRLSDLDAITIKNESCIGITAVASTHDEFVQKVTKHIYGKRVRNRD